MNHTSLPDALSPEQMTNPPSPLYTLIAQQPFLAGLHPQQLQLLAESALEMFTLHLTGTFERPSRLVLDVPIWLDTLICQLM